MASTVLVQGRKVATLKLSAARSFITCMRWKDDSWTAQCPASHTSVRYRQNDRTVYPPFDIPKVRGVEILRDPSINKGVAFSLKERQLLGIHGLLPPIVFSPDKQLQLIMANFHRCDTDLDRYIFMTSLLDRNEKLFYRMVTEHVELLAPIIYTPTVGLACQKYGQIFRRPRGLFITINDMGYINEVLSNWPERVVKAIVVTDGERILGLGDLGACGMGIPVGKLCLYTALAGVQPKQCLPIQLDVGTDNEELLSDENYIGLRHKRVRGSQYDDFIDEFVEAATRRFGHGVLIQFEDFANYNAFRLLEKYRDKILTFNDDIQGTAAVAVAGIYAALRITNNTFADHKIFFFGAGEAATGIAYLLVMAMEAAGLSKEEAISKIWMADKGGLLVSGRPTGDLDGEKSLFVKDFEYLTNLEEMINKIQPTCIIGAAAVPGAFSENVLKAMASYNERPIVFALSNPTSKAECTAEQAYVFTDGKAIFASGSPFDQVEYKGKIFHPGQGNNAYIFPGVALAAIASRMRHIPDEFFLKSSQILADMVTEEHLDAGRLYPPLKELHETSTHLAARLVQFAYDKGWASAYPEPEDKLQHLKEVHQYNLNYESFIPKTYAWPGMPDHGDW